MDVWTNINSEAIFKKSHLSPVWKQIFVHKHISTRFFTQNVIYQNIFV